MAKVDVGNKLRLGNGISKLIAKGMALVASHIQDNGITQSFEFANVDILDVFVGESSFYGGTCDVIGHVVIMEGRE